MLLEPVVTDIGQETRTPAQLMPRLHKNLRRSAEEYVWSGRFALKYGCRRISPAATFKGDDRTRPILNSTFTILHSPALQYATLGLKHRPSGC